MPLRDLLVAIIFFGSLPRVIFNPHIGVYLWSWIGYMNPHRLGWGFMYDYPLGQIVAGITLIAVLFSSESKTLPRNPVVYIWMLFIFWMCITTNFAIHPTAAQTQLVKVLKIQLFIGLTLMMINTKERINGLVWVIVLSIGFFGFKGGLFTILHGGQYMVLGAPASFIEGNTEIGFALVIVVPLLNYLRISSNDIWIRRGVLFGTVLCAFAIIGTQSRGALLAGGGVALFLWLKSSKKMLSGIIIAITAVTIFSIMPDKYFDKMETIQTYEEDASAMGRINAWRIAYQIANDYPLVGGGFDTFSKYTYSIYAPHLDKVLDVHSIYFQVLGEHGYVGLFLFLVLGILTWKSARQIIRLSYGFPQLDWASDLTKMIQVSLVGFCVGGSFLGLAYFDLPYHLMAIVILVREIVEKERRKMEQVIHE